MCLIITNHRPYCRIDDDESQVTLSHFKTLNTITFTLRLGNFRIFNEFSNRIYDYKQWQMYHKQQIKLNQYQWHICNNNKIEYVIQYFVQTFYKNVIPTDIMKEISKFYPNKNILNEMKKYNENTQIESDRFSLCGCSWGLFIKHHSQYDDKYISFGLQAFSLPDGVTEAIVRCDIEIIELNKIIWDALTFKEHYVIELYSLICFVQYNVCKNLHHLQLFYEIKLELYGSNVCNFSFRVGIITHIQQYETLY